MRLRALGCHVFAGGMTVGVREHFDIVGHLEAGPFGAETARKNLDIPVWDKPVDWPLDSVTGLDLLYGNPACSGWSPLNLWHNGPKSKQNDGIRQFLHTANVLRPRAVLLESVRQLVGRGAEWLDQVDQPLRAVGYTRYKLLVNAADVSVPQVRRRVFVIWALDDMMMFSQLPAREPVTVGEVLARPGLNHQEFRQTKEDFLFKHVKPGKGLIDVDDEYLARLPSVLRKKHENMLHLHWPYRLDPAKPSRVVYSSWKYLHPVEDRLISLGEASRLMGNPDDFIFYGKDKMAQCGKAVCPPIAAWVAGELERELTR